MKERNRPPERRRRALPFVLLPSLGMALPASGQEPYVYPTKGQSPEKMSADKAQCQVWATEQTGFDPLSSAADPTSPPAQTQRGGVLKGGAKGAAGGAAIGAIAGDAGKGAEIGAVSGGLLGGARKRREQRAEQKAQSQQAQAQSQSKSNFLRADGSCLKGRGYSIN